MTLFAVWLFLVTAPISIFDIRTTGDAVSPDEKSEIENKEPDLFQAIEKDDADAIKALSDKINVPDENGWTPLMHAAVKGSEDTVKLLITGGADVNADADGITAMKIAIMFNRPENAQILADAGADIDATDEDGKTALDYAREKGRDEIVLLLEKVVAGETAEE